MADFQRLKTTCYCWRLPLMYFMLLLPHFGHMGRMLYSRPLYGMQLCYQCNFIPLPGFHIAYKLCVIWDLQFGVVYLDGV